MTDKKARELQATLVEDIATSRAEFVAAVRGYGADRLPDIRGASDASMLKA
jgi:hypothetical protein